MWWKCTAYKVSEYWVFSGPCFSVFDLNTKIYRINLCIQARKNSHFLDMLPHSGCFKNSVQIVLKCKIRKSEKLNTNKKGKDVLRMLCCSKIKSTGGVKSEGREVTFWITLSIKRPRLLHTLQYTWRRCFTLSIKSNLYDQNRGTYELQLVFFNPLLANFHNSYPLKTLQSLWFSEIFRGYKIGKFVKNWLIFRFMR